MNALKRIEELHGEFLEVLQVLKIAEKSAKEIITTVEERIETDRRQNESRIAELEAKSKDFSKSETVRHLAEIELNKYKAYTFGVTSEERTEFETQIATGKTAVHDLLKLKEEMRTAIDEANEHIQKMRADTLGNMLFDTLKSCIDDAPSQFEKMCRRIEGK